MKNGGLFVGRDSYVEFIPPSPLANDLHLILSHLVYSRYTKPQQLVDALACVASIVKHMGPPITVIKNPHKDWKEWGDWGKPGGGL